MHNHNHSARRRRSEADRCWTDRTTEPAPSSGLLAVALLAVIVLSVL